MLVTDTCSHPNDRPGSADDSSSSSSSSSTCSVAVPVESLKGWDHPAEEGLGNPGWLTVLGTFIINFYTWGLLVSWGIFQVLYLDVYAGQTDEFRIAFVGTSASASVLGMGLVAPWLLRVLGFRGMVVLGSVLCPLSMVLASFARALWVLYCTHGAMLGIGVGLCYTASSTLPAYWFVRNRAFATGLAASGTCLGPMVFSPAIQALVLHLGYRNALRVLGAAGLVLTGAGTALIRTPPGRAKAAAATAAAADGGRARMWTWAYGFYLVHSFLAPFGYVAPIFLAPSYAAAVGASPQLASVCLSVVEGANGVARIVFGWVGDHGGGRINVVAGATLASGVLTVALWQQAHSVGVYVGYLVLFGLTGGVFAGLQPVIAGELVGMGRIQQGVGVSYFLSMFGHLFGTSIVGLLHIRAGWTPAIQFAGSASLAAAAAVLVTRILQARQIK